MDWVAGIVSPTNEVTFFYLGKGIKKYYYAANKSPITAKLIFRGTEFI